MIGTSVMKELTAALFHVKLLIAKFFLSHVEHHIDYK